MSKHIVTFEFTNRSTAEAFCDAVSDWLGSRIKATRADLEKMGLDIDNLPAGASPTRHAYWRVPRHWYYEDASPSLTTVSKRYGQSE